MTFGLGESLVCTSRLENHGHLGMIFTHLIPFGFRELCTDFVNLIVGIQIGNGDLSRSNTHNGAVQLMKTMDIGRPPALKNTPFEGQVGITRQQRTGDLAQLGIVSLDEYLLNERVSITMAFLEIWISFTFANRTPIVARRQAVATITRCRPLLAGIEI